MRWSIELHTKVAIFSGPRIFVDWVNDDEAHAGHLCVFQSDKEVVLEFAKSSFNLKSKFAGNLIDIQSPVISRRNNTKVGRARDGIIGNFCSGDCLEFGCKSDIDGGLACVSFAKNNVPALERAGFVFSVKVGNQC